MRSEKESVCYIRGISETCSPLVFEPAFQHLSVVCAANGTKFYLRNESFQSLTKKFMSN